MSRHRDVSSGEAYPAKLFDGMGEYLSTLASNFIVAKQSPTTVGITAGSGNDQVALGIAGCWRFISASVSAAHRGGAAGLYDVWAVSHANDEPSEDLGTFSYDFTLKIGAPSGTGGEAISRKVATLLWDGAAIKYLNPLVGPVADARHGVRLARSTNFSVPNAADTPVPWETEIEDTDGFWTVGSPSAITIPISGLYIVTFGVQWDFIGSGGGGDTMRRIRLRHTPIAGPVLAYRAGQGAPPSDNVDEPQQVTLVWPMEVGDTLQGYAWQESGIARNVKPPTTGSGGGSGTYISAYRMSA